ncbi:hypothetical protein BH09PLA1_BH09PLA1_15290 [soil metagenome]
MPVNWLVKMRDIRRLGGVALLLLFALCSAVLGQASGQVESIGFDNRFRGECWTPMLIDLRPETSKSDQYQIQVKQEDLDRDHPIFTRTISLTGNTEGGAQRQQKFRMYFKPQPTSDGLPDSRTDPNALKTLQDLLQVSLCSASGKWLAPLPITASVQDLDPRGGTYEFKRGNRFVLVVYSGNSAPVWQEYRQSIGLLEDMTFISVQPSALPESVIGYDAVDSIVWLNADPSELKSGTDEKFRALENFVKRGGSLTICTPTDWQKMLAFGAMLPVNLEGIDTKNDPEPLRTLGRTRFRQDGTVPPNADGWDGLRGPFTLARATAKPGAVTEYWIDWKENDRTPWLVRKPFGAGAVTWIAQDLGDPSVTAARQNWPYIWDRVLDLPNLTRIVSNQTSDGQKMEFGQANAVDIGYSLLSGMELQGKSAWLITLAVVFFIGYWLFAGPGVFAFLATRKQTSLSWFFFAASALAATALTVLVVRITLRGEPEMKHISLVRAAAGEPAVVYSRFGLYIPRDGMQRIELKDMTLGSLTTLSAFSIHPQHLDNSKVPDDPGPEYVVNVRDADSSEAAMVRVPYRTTLKKFEADWTGNAGGRVEGSAKLLPLSNTGYISGNLTNGTGRRLKNIYIAFRYPRANVRRGYEDWIMYVPSWDAGASIDLNKEFNPKTEDGKPVPAAIRESKVSPLSNVRFRGVLTEYWEWYWASALNDMSLSMGERKYDDYGKAAPRVSIPMLSFFSRLEPLRNTELRVSNRFEFLRRAARRYDVSPALSAGALVVVAEPDENVPIPIPLFVEGQQIQGTGSTVYQFILPLDPGEVWAPTTQPSDEN